MIEQKVELMVEQEQEETLADGEEYEVVEGEEEYEVEEEGVEVEEAEEDSEMIDDPTYEEKPARRPRRQKSLEENNACNLCQRMFKTPAVSNV